MAHLYFVDHQQRLIAGERVELADAEARHAAKVARLRVGEQITLGDTRGVLARAEATAVSAESVALVVLDVTHTDSWQPELWLGQSLAKSGRDEQAIEQAVEVGVNRVIPLTADRCVVRWDSEKAERGVKRWQKIVTEASKQALQPRVASVVPPHSLSELIDASDQYQLIALDHRAQSTLLDVALEGAPDSPPIVVLVGPEGGWSDDEFARLEAAGISLARLGPGVLRTSSAGPIALALLHARLQHW